MLIQPGRIFARTAEEAVLTIRDRYGPGRLTIYPVHTQPLTGLTWYEFYIVLPEKPEE